MSQLEYDRFIFEGNIVELADALEQPDKIDLLTIYDKDRLFCPECHIAQLKFTRGTTKRRAFLSTKQGTSTDPNTHAPDCSHSFEKATKKQVKRYYDNLSKEQINDKLDAAINRYLRMADQHGKNRPVMNIENNPAIAHITENGQTIHRRLPTRSIYSIYDIADEELNIPLLLYGNVYLSVSVHEKKVGNELRHYYQLTTHNKNTRSRIRFFNRGQQKDLIYPNVLYHTVMLVVFSRNQDGRLQSSLYKQAVRFIAT